MEALFEFLFKYRPVVFEKGRLAFAAGPGTYITVDLLSPGLTRLAGHDWDGAGPDPAGSGPPVTVERLDAIAARALGLATTGSLLVRPDGRPVALGVESGLTLS